VLLCKKKIDPVSESGVLIFPETERDSTTEIWDVKIIFPTILEGLYKNKSKVKGRKLTGPVKLNGPREVNDSPLGAEGKTEFKVV